MLMLLVARLVNLGLDTQATDAGIVIEGVEFGVERRERAPYPNEVAALEAKRALIAETARPLLVAPYVSEPTGETLIKAGWSWADSSGNYDLRAAGLILRERQPGRKAPRPKHQLPLGSGSLAIIRSLIRSRDEVDPTALAGAAAVTQPRASQVLAQLTALGLVERPSRTVWRVDRPRLLDRFLAEYQGSGGTATYHYSLAPLTSLAITLAEKQRTNCVISADVGTDLVAPWRQPSVLVVYARAGFSLQGVDRVLAQGREDANVIVRSPSDTSIFPNPPVVATVHGIEVPLADPAQMMWDLLDLGGPDRLEAAGVIREWILKPQ
jgi:hypothetical protein